MDTDDCNASLLHVCVIIIQFKKKIKIMARKLYGKFCEDLQIFLDSTCVSIFFTYLYSYNIIVSFLIQIRNKTHQSLFYHLYEYIALEITCISSVHASFE